MTQIDTKRSPAPRGPLPTPLPASSPRKESPPAAPAAGQSAASSSGTPATDRFTAAQRQGATAGASDSAGKKYAEYDKLLADGKLEIAIGVGYDENSADVSAWGNLTWRIESMGFKKDLVTDEGVHVYRKRMTIRGKETEVVINAFQGRNSDKPLDKFTEAMSSSEIVIYSGHARYGSGPDFNDIKDNDQNYFIGRGYTSDHKPENLYEGKSSRGLRNTDTTQQYQIMALLGCRTKDYEAQIRKRLKGTKNLDLLLTKDLAYWNTLPEAIGIFVGGLTKGQDVGTILKDLNQKIKGEDVGKDLFYMPGTGDNRYQPGTPIPDAKSVADVLAGRVTLGPSKEYSPLVERAQKLLVRAGIPLGGHNDSFPETDGRFGDKTTQAVKTFQKREGLPVNGTIDGGTLKKLQQFSGFAKSPRGPVKLTLQDVAQGRLVLKQSAQVSGVVRQAQQLLRRAGYKIGADGIFGSGTEGAVRDYQRKEKIPVTGVIDGATLQRLSNIPM